MFNNKTIKIFLALAAALAVQNAGAWGAVWELAPDRNGKEWVRGDSNKTYSPTYKGLYVPLVQGAVFNEKGKHEAYRKAVRECASVKNQINRDNRARGGGATTMHCRVDHVFRKECVALATVTQGYKIKGRNKFLAAFGEKRKVYTASYIEQHWSGINKATKWFKKDAERKARNWCNKPRSVLQIPGDSKGVVQECHIVADCDWWWGK